jgi:hypothetical protein
MQFYSRNLFRNPTATDSNGGSPQGAKPMAITDLTLEIVTNMKPEQQDAMMKSFDKRVTGIKDTQKEVKVESKRAAILLAGVDLRVKRGIEAGVYASTFTVSDLYKQVTGNKPPGHVFTLKCAYVNYVMAGKISEADFLGNRNNCLELAQKIADAVIELKHPEGLQHDAVTRAATELKDRHENEAKILRGILASVKPAKVMTPEEAIEMVEAIFAAGHFSMGIAHVVTDLVKTAPENIQRETVIALLNGAVDVETYVGPDKVNTWAANTKAAMEDGVQHVNGTEPASDAPAAPASEPSAEADEATRIESELAAAE